MNIKITLLLIILQQICFNLFSQSLTEQGSPLIKLYKDKDYDGSAQIWTCVQDNRGIMYFGDNSGILEFDGINWKRISNTNSSNVRALAVDKNGRVYAGCLNEFGYLSPDKSGDMQYVSISHMLPENEKKFLDIYAVECTDNAVYFLSTEYLFIYSNYQLIKKAILPRFYRILKYGNTILLTYEDGVKNLKDTVLYPVEGLNGDLNSVIPLTENKVLFSTYSDNWITFDTITSETSNFETPAYEYFNEHEARKLVRIDNERFAVATKTGGVVILSNSGEVLQIINDKRGLFSGSVYTPYVDSDKNLWACMSKGIAKINTNYPLTVFDSKQNLKTNINTSIQFNNTTYLGTSDGILYLPAYQMKTDGEDNHNFELINDINDEIWQFEVFNDKLFAIGNYAIYIIKDSTVNLFFDTTIKSRCLTFSKKRPNIIFYGMRNAFGYVKLNETNNDEYSDSYCYPEIEGKIRNMAEDKDGNLWLWADLVGIYYVRFLDNSLKNYTISLLDTTNGLPDLIGITILNLQNEILLATSDGIYKPEFAINKVDSLIMFQKTSIFKDKIKGAIVQIIQINDNKYFINGNCGYYAEFIGDSLKIDTCGFKLIQNLYEFRDVDVRKNGTLGITSYEAFLSFNANFDRDYQKTFNTIIRKVTVNKDSVIFNGCFYTTSDSIQKSELFQLPEFIPVLKYSENSIEFEFAGLFYEETEFTEFQYFLEGFDKEWSSFSTENKVNYTRLHEGNYTFKVKAVNVYGAESNIAEYKFRILPPWYRTIWAYTVYLILLTGFIYMIVKLNTKRLVQQKEQLEMIVIERTAEISQQKEELQTQADYLLDKNTEIEQQKNIIEKKNQNITASIIYASYIQKAMLWRSNILDDYFSDNFILFKPRDIVSGDFYYIQKVNDFLIIVAADCTGHGVPGAFMSVMGFMYVNDVVAKREITKASDALEMLRENIKYALQQRGQRGDQQDGMDLSLISIHLPTLKANFAGANNPLWLISNTELTIYKGDKQPIGIYLKEKPFTNHEIQLQKGDKIYLFSDGYYSQFGGEKGRKMKLAEFQNQIKSISNKPMNEQEAYLEQYLEYWKGADKEQIDDILIIGIAI